MVDIFLRVLHGFLAKEMNVRKTVTPWFPKASNRLVVTGDQEIMNGNRNCRDSYYGVETDRSQRTLIWLCRPPVPKEEGIQLR